MNGVGDVAHTVLVVGGVGAGVSTLLEQITAYGKGMCLPGRDMRKLYSTVGVDITNHLKVKGVGVKVIEVGGSMLSLAHRQVEHNALSGVVFVIDPTQPAELPTSTIELYNLLNLPKSDSLPFLVVISKSDAPSKLSLQTISDAIASYSLRDNFDVHIVSASGVTGTGMSEIFSWLERKVIQR